MYEYCCVSVYFIYNVVSFLIRLPQLYSIIYSACVFFGRVVCAHKHTRAAWAGLSPRISELAHSHTRKSAPHSTGVGDLPVQAVHDNVL